MWRCLGLAGWGDEGVGLRAGAEFASREIEIESTIRSFS